MQCAGCGRSLETGIFVDGKTWHEVCATRYLALRQANHVAAPWRMAVQIVLGIIAILALLASCAVVWFITMLPGTSDFGPRFTFATTMLLCVAFGCPLTVLYGLFKRWSVGAGVVLTTAYLAGWALLLTNI